MKFKLRGQALVVEAVQFINGLLPSWSPYTSDETFHAPEFAPGTTSWTVKVDIQGPYLEIEDEHGGFSRLNTFDWLIRINGIPNERCSDALFNILFEEIPE